MAEVTRVALALFIIGFWLVLPLPMQLFDLSGYSQWSSDIINEPTTGIGILDTAVDVIQVYFQLLTFDIPGISNYIRYFINFLQIASLVFVGFMLRGN